MAWDHYYINCEKIYDKEERRDEPFCFYELDIPPHGGIRREWTTRGMKHGQASIFFVEYRLEDDDPDGVWEAYGQKRDSEYSYTVHAEEADPEKIFAYTLYQDGSLRAGFDIDTDAACAILVLPRAQAITAAQLRDAWEQVKAAPRVSGAAEEIIRKELLGGAEDVLCLAISRGEPMAIGISVTKEPRVYDLGASKFFGTPTVPKTWLDDFDEDEIFLCQLRLADIAALDKENRLPHREYLYVFLHTGDGNWSLRADVRYSETEPELAIDEFNAAVPGYEGYCDAWLMAFSPVEDDADGIRLLGVPSDWNYMDEPPKLLLQYDPLAGDMGFLDAMDGYLYLFFGADTRDFAAVALHAEYS